MKKLKLTSETIDNIVESLLKRSPSQYTEYEPTVHDIVNDVRANGDKAIFAYTKKFDGAEINASNIVVTKEEIEEAYSLVSEELVEVIRKALVNIEKYHVKQKQNSWFTSEEGVILGQAVKLYILHLYL